MMTLTEKIFSLKSASCFESLEHSDLVMIADIARERIYAPSEVFCDSGQILRKFYVVTEGNIQNEAGKNMPPILGPASLLFDIPVSDKLLASTSKGAKCLAIAKGHFFTVVYRCPSFLCRFLEMKDFEVKTSLNANQIK